jgi:hypothetical protein
MDGLSAQTAAEEGTAVLLLLLFMSMGWEYVSELRPPTGLLFIPEVT